MTRLPLLLGAALLAGAAAYVLWPSAATPPQTDSAAAGATGTALVQVTLPDLSQTAQIGKTIFDNSCANCHGANAAGTDGVAPPLVHIIYEPSHHGDEAFQRAAAQGVQAHHWPFGNMPPVPGLTRGDVTMVVEYVRSLQRANGIH